MRKLSDEEYEVIMNKHEKFLNNEKGGERADFSYVDFEDANLRSANLEDANLRSANLEDANLRSANLEDANLIRANLIRANLIRANLIRANLEDANLRSANLEDANLDFSCLPLWCGGINFKIDEKIAKQIMYHLMNLMECSEIELKEYFHEKAFEFVNNSHVVTQHGLTKFEVPKKEIQGKNSFLDYFRERGF